MVLKVINKNDDFIWLIPFCNDLQKDDYVCILDQMEKNRAARFKDPAHQIKFIYYHAALRKILSKYGSKAPSQIEYSFNERGKPFIQGSNVNFSFSRSDDLATCGISLDCSIGIDIEKIVIDVDFEGIISTFFSKEEKKALTSLKEENRLLGFFSIWTGKEAYGKALGIGITFPLAEVTIPVYDSRSEQTQIQGLYGDIWMLWRFIYHDNSGKYFLSFITSNLNASIRTFTYKGIEY